MRPTQHVLVVSHGFQSHYELGFANGLAENGLAVVLLGSDTTLSAKLHPSVAFHNIRGSQSPQRSRWRKAWGLLSYHARLLRHCFKHRGEPMVIIGMLNPEWLVGVIESFVLRCLAGELALVVHNVLPHNEPSQSKQLAYRLIYRIPHVLLAHTRATQADLQRDFNIQPQRMLLVPHGLNDAVKPLPISKAAAKAAIGLRPEQGTVLFFGRVSHYKGADLLLDALAQCPDLHLLMIGKSGADPHCQAVRMRMPGFVEAGRAQWVDAYVDDDTVERYFAAADVTVLPYRQIDQSGVLLLSLTLGVPVLVTSVGGFSDVVNHANSMPIAEASTQAVLAALRAFFAEPGRFDRDQVASTVAQLAWKETLSAYSSRWTGRQADAGHAPHPGRRDLSIKEPSK